MARRSSSASAVAAVLLLLVSVSVDAQLWDNFYFWTCPQAEGIVNSIVRARVNADRTIAPSLLRLHFHDCFVNGCDGSVLIDSTPSNTAEKDAPPNKGSLRGFDVIDEIKSALEAVCFQTVSCADIVALVARDATVAINGPYWDVPTGRRDGLQSSAALASADLPSPESSIDLLIEKFEAVGLNKKDVVVLSGSHTIGRAHCAAFSNRLYNFPGSADGIDPSLDNQYALQLRESCPPGSTNLVNMDPSGGGETFDTNYYANVIAHKGLFPSDQALLNNSAVGIVESEVFNQLKFFYDFGAAMVKMGKIGVLTLSSPSTGEIRKNCTVVN